MTDKKNLKTFELMEHNIPAGGMGGAKQISLLPKQPKKKKPKVIGLKQLLQKQYETLEGLPEVLRRSFGELVANFIMIVWAQSGSGKSNFIYQFLSVLMQHGNVLYISLEEGTEKSAQMLALRHLNTSSHSGRILFADAEMTYEEAVPYLRRKKSPRFVVVDSVQYWNINYARYRELKELFPKKGFIFISHAAGKNPDGKTADKIRYDAGIKVRVEGFVAFPVSRYGGNKPYIIWEGKNRNEGAWAYWGKKEVNEFKK
jgi:hypothetical protein